MELRKAVPSDIGYVVSSFISGIREASTQVEGMTGRQVATLITNLMSNDWTCTVAELEGIIGGWVVHRPDQHLAWIHTRNLFRRQGLAKLMLSSVGIDLGRPVYSPFLANRDRDKCPLRLRVHQRPFLCVAENVPVH